MESLYEKRPQARSGDAASPIAPIVALIPCCSVNPPYRLGINGQVDPNGFTRMDPLHATIEEFAADGYSHVECYCPRCRMIRLRPISWLPRISLGLTVAQLSARLRCAECGGQVHSVKPWRMEDVLGKPQGRRG